MSGKTNYTNRLPQVESQNVIAVYSEADFGTPVSGVVTLAPFTTYVLKTSITLTIQFDLSGLPAFGFPLITSEMPEANNLINIGSGGPLLITSNTTLGAAIGLIDLRIINAASRVFADIETLVPFGGSLNFKNTFFIGFSPGSIFKGFQLGFRDACVWNDSGRIDLVDTDIEFDGSFITNTVDANDVLFDISTSNVLSNPVYKFNNVGLSSHPNEPAFFVHSNLTSASLVLFTRMFNTPFSPGTGGFLGTKTGSVTAMADAGGGNVLVTAAGHNGVEGDTITHTTFSDSNYNGDFVIANVIAGTSYEIMATFTATGTGIWTNRSIDETDVRINSLNNERAKQKDSMTLCEATTNGALIVDGSGGIDVPVVGLTPTSGDWLEDPATERIMVDSTTGILTYNGLVEISVELRYKFSATPTSGPSQQLEFDLHINTVQQEKTVTILDTANTSEGSYIGGIFTLSNGDTIQLFKNNLTNTNNTNVSATVLLIAIK